MALNFANNNSLSAITTKPSGLSGGAMNLISTQTASSSSTISFTSGIDDTYDEYVFKFINIHPATDGADLTFQVDTGTNTNYNQTMTPTAYRAQQREDSADAQLYYDSHLDQAQGTAFLQIQHDIGSDNDQSASGEMTFFNPSSSVFVKHFMSRNQVYYKGDYSLEFYTAGYINTTTPLTRVQFKMTTGNIDSGVIKLYGIS